MSGIYTLRDLRSLAPKELRGASDSVLINEYAKDLGVDPVEVAQYFGLGQQGGMASNRIGAGIDNYQANMYGLVGAGARALGANQVAGWADRNREANELQADIATLRARDLGAVDDWRDVRGIGSGLNYVGGLAAQSLPYLAEAAVGGLAARGVMTGTRAALAAAQTPQAAAAARRALNIGSMAGAVGASYPSAVGDVLSNQRDEAGVENLGSAAIGGVPYAALNAIGAEGVVARGLRPLSGVTERRMLRRMGEQGGKTALTEGVAETGQEMVNQYFGRMAVNPDQTMFNEDANRRYLDAFIGGAALGGSIGTLAGVRRPIDESFNYDLTQRDTTPPSPTTAQAGPTARLGYSPLAGTPIVFPDGSVALNGEQELQARYGTPPTPTAAPSAPTNQTQAAVDENADLDALILDRTSLKPSNKMRTFAKRIVGLDLEAVDPDTEVAVWNALAERKYGAAEKLLKAFEESAAANDRQNVVAPAGAPATQPGTGDIPALPTAATPDAAVAAVSQPPTARAGQPAGAAQNTADQGAVNRVVSSGGSTAASLPASASAGVGVSSTQTDGTQTAQAQQAAPQGSTAASIRPATGQPAAGAPSAPVEAVGVTGRSKLTLKRNEPGGLSLEDRAEIESLTGNTNNATALLGEVTGQRQDARTFTDADRDAVLDKLFEGAQDKDRMRRMFWAFRAVTDNAKRGNVGRIKDAVGADFGVGRKMVDKVGNPAALVQAGKELGYTEAEVVGMFDLKGAPRKKSSAAPEVSGDVSVNDVTVDLKAGIKRLSDEIEQAKSDPTTKRLRTRATVLKSRAKGEEGATKAATQAELDEVQAQLQRRADEQLQKEDELKSLRQLLKDVSEERGAAKDSDLAKALAAAGYTTEDGDSTGIRLDDNREWQKESSSGNQEGDVLLRLYESIENVRANIAALEEQGLTNSVGILREQLSDMNAKLEAAISKAAENDTQKPTSANLDDATKAAKQRLKEAKGDVTKLSDEDLPLIRDEYARLKNTDGVAKVEAEMQKRGVGTPTEAAPTEAAPTEAALRSDADRAAAAWDKVAKELEGAPLFSELPRGKQKTFIEYGEGNWTRQDVLTELAKIDRQREEAARDGTVLENIDRLTSEPSVYAEAAKRAPSLRRELTKLQKMLDKGELTPDAFAARVELALQMTQRERTRNPRERGADYIRQRLLEAKRRGDLSERAVDMAEWFIQKNPALVDDLAISIKSSKADGASGIYDPLYRLMTLIKDSSNDETTVHEILHHLERMMPEPVQAAIRKSWLKSMANAAKAAEKSGDKNLKQFYGHLLDYHLGNADTGGFQSQMNAAIRLLKEGLVGYDHYQHVNPSEFWAVNGSRIVEGRFDAKGTVLTRLKQWLRELGQKIKAVFGMQSDAPILQALDSLAKADGKFVSTNMLMEGVNYADLSKAGSREGGAEGSLGRLVSRAAKAFTNTWSQEPVQAIVDTGAAFGPYKDPAKFVVRDDYGDFHMFIMSQDGAQRAADLSEAQPGRSLEKEIDTLAYFAGQHFIYDPSDFSFEAAGPADKSWAAKELRKTRSLSYTGEFWDEFESEPITRMEGVSHTHLVRSLGQFLAFVKKQTGQETVPVAWERITGANIGKVGGGYMNIERPTASTVQKNVAKLPKPMQGPVRNTVLGVGDVASKVLDRVVFTSTLIERAAKAGIGSAQKFARLQYEMGTKARELEREVEKIADMYADVPEQDKGSGPRSLNQFLFESTRQGKWGYGKDADPEMKDWFDSLQPNSQKLVKAIFAHGDKMLARKKQAVMDHTNTEYDALIKAAQDEVAKATTTKERQDAQKYLAELKTSKADSLKKFETLFKIREGKPYAPIKRMGNYAVVAKSQAYRDAEAKEDTAELRKLEQDPDHYHVTFTDTKGEARRLADRLREQGFYGQDDNAVYFFERSNDVELFGGESTLKALTQLRSKVDGTDGKSEAQAKAQMQRIVTDMWLTELAEGSARKSEMRRRGIAGEVDMIQSFAVQGRADAQFVASVEYNPQIQDTMTVMKKEIKRGGAVDRKTEIHNELMERYAKSLEVVNTPVIDKLTRMSSVYFLASSPMYYLQNLTQPWMMSVPAMARNHDYTKVSAALTKAYSELGPVLKSGKLFETGFDFTQVPADVKGAIQELVNRGRIDIGLDTELGEFRVDGSSKFGTAWNKVDKGLRLLVQKGEAVNRLSTAIAAYRLELARTNSHEAALDYTDKILLDTHGDYGRFNAPKYFNTSLGRVALQFRKFQLIQLTFYGNLIKEAFTDPKERKLALRTLGFALGHTALLAGAMGLPGYAAIAWALGAVLGDDEPFDLTYEMRKLIGNEQMANLIMRGAPTLAGADISGKVGAGTMISIMPFSNADLSTPQGQAQAAGTLIGGASLGMGMRIADGLGLMLSGDWVRGAELVLPKGLGDAIRGAREASDGVTRRNGDVILPPEEVSAVEAVMQAIGMPPVQTTVTNERRSRAFEMDKHFRERTTRIKNDYARAFRARDAEGMRRAREDWASLQEARRRNGYAVQPVSNLLRAPQEQVRRERNTAGGVQFNNSNRAFAEQQAAI